MIGERWETIGMCDSCYKEPADILYRREGFFTREEYFLCKQCLIKKRLTK